ncbi:MAG: type IV toxin-antitoxin system AbiEi family antitoxin [Clostridium sp.]|nr:type IV toxin-antitoxin system AbiEi family antitoxin [Clostridium sp.]
MLQKTESLSDWTESRILRGYYTFTRADVRKQFPDMSDAYLRLSLHRLISRGKIISPWRNFYVVMPVEYALKGVIPPVFYIDQMMEFLNRKYYVSLLNAAAFYGAAHQRAQTYSVAVELPSIRDTRKNGVSIAFISKKTIPEHYIVKHRTQTGYVNVSSPELTAVDLIENEKKIGGLNRVCTVLNELAEAINIDEMDDGLLSITPLTTFQRLGYILDSILEYDEKASALYRRLMSAGMKFRKTPFKIGKPVEGFATDEKWKIIINQEIDIDE